MVGVTALGVTVLDEVLGDTLDVAVLDEDLGGVTLAIIDFVLGDAGEKISLLTGIDPGERDIKTGIIYINKKIYIYIRIHPLLKEKVPSKYIHL